MPTNKEVYCALVVGAGTLENSWTPVIRALKKLNPHIPLLTPQGANSYLATTIFLLRHLWSLRETDFGRVQLQLRLELFTELKEEIVLEIKNSEIHKEIRVRPQFNEVVEKFIFQKCKTFTVISTNWDTVIDKAIYEFPYFKNSNNINWDIKTLHLHGEVKNPNNLYLPTEVTNEPYRTSEERSAILNLHESVITGLNKCHNIILYGISISPLDAELCLTLSAGWDNDNLTLITIIDPCHISIAERVMILLPNSRKITVLGYDPSDLNNPTDYSLK